MSSYKERRALEIHSRQSKINAVSAVPSSAKLKLNVVEPLIVRNKRLRF